MVMTKVVIQCAKCNIPAEFMHLDTSKINWDETWGNAHVAKVGLCSKHSAMAVGGEYHDISYRRQFIQQVGG